MNNNNNNINIITTNLNFGGFYDSIHSYNIEEYINDREIKEEEINYQTLYKEYSKEYIRALNCELDTNINYIDLISPKYYNFSTDYLQVSITKKDILKLSTFIKDNELKEELKENIKEATTIRDGYIPYYNYNDIFKKDNISLLVELMLDTILIYLDNNFTYDMELDYIY